MKYEEQEVYLVINNHGTNTGLKVFDSRADALRFTRGDRRFILRKRVIPYSGRGPYRKPWTPRKPIKKRVPK